MNSPFKFLDAYSKDDKDIFFGRSNDVRSLFEKVHLGRLLLIYGASGTGKTSIIQCGLANQFQDTDWFPLVTRRNDNIIKATYQNIRDNAIHSITEINIPSHEDIINGFESLYLDFYKPIFLIYDQFEELFVSGDDSEINNFFELLNKLLNSDLQLKVIIVIREEFLAQLTNMENIVPELFKNRQRVEPMSPSNIREVITNSCNQFNIRLESETIPNQIYEKIVGENNRVELTHLQVYLDRLYKLAYDNNLKSILFSKELIDSVGHLEDILGTFLTEQVSNLEKPKLGWQILKLFITEKGTKRNIDQLQLSALLKNQNIATEDGVSIISNLLKNRVLRIVGNDNSYEFSHDSLAQKVFDRLSIQEKSLLEVKLFIEQEFTNYKARNVLLSKEDLDYINPYLNDLNLSKKQKQLIDKSKRELSKKKKRLVATAISIIVILSILSAYSYIQKIEAEEAEKVALDAKKQALEAVDALELKETQRLEEVAKNIMIEVNNLLDGATELKKRDRKELAKTRINTAIDILENYPDNPELVEKLNQIKSNYDH